MVSFLITGHIFKYWLESACIYNRSKRYSGTGCFSLDTYGGGGGYAFNEVPNNCGAVIRKITIRAARVVDSIQITYRLSNGQYHTAGRHGGLGGRQHVIYVDVNNGEKIIGIFGKSAALVDQLGFVTNKGRIYGPYGGCGGRNFHVSSCLVRGIFGRSAQLLNSIGFHCSYVWLLIFYWHWWTSNYVVVFSLK